MTSATITDLIPHRAPFIMIDTLVESSARRALSALVVRADNILVDEDGWFTESGLVENMAQTAAAGLRENDAGAAPKIGYIGSLKNLSVLRLPAVGETIMTEAVFVQEIMGARIVAATARLGDEVIARCELRIFIQQ